MIKAAIFDVDGTLLDSMGIWEDAGARFLAWHGITALPGLGKILFPMSLEEGAAYLKAEYAPRAANDRKGHAPSDHGLSGHALLGHALSEQEIIAGVLDVIRDFYYEEAQLKPGAQALLDELAAKNIPMAVATSSDEELVRRAFSRLGISHRFCAIFTCSQVGAGKDSPEIYRQACRYLGAQPQDTWVFEDTLFALKTAAQAGFKTAGVYDGASEGDTEAIRQLADVWLPSLTQTSVLWRAVDL